MQAKKIAPKRAEAQARPETACEVARFIRGGLDAEDFGSTGALLVAVDKAFPDITFRDFVAGYFLSSYWRQNGRRRLQ